MASRIFLLALGAGIALSQGVPPPPETLDSTESGVIPVAPTPFSGEETNEGALVNDGPPNPSFTPVDGPAPIQSNLPAATYQAVFPEYSFDNLTGTNIAGSIKASSASGGTGVTFDVNLSGLPDVATYGPFVYHVHVLPVPADGDCTATLGHLDPTNRGELYPCNAGAPATCQAGDLSGKHGNITTGGVFTTSYVENYLSTESSSPYFFGNLAVVIHSSNATRLTCANFVLADASNSNSTIPPVNNSTTPPVVSPSGFPSPSNANGTAPGVLPNGTVIPAGNGGGAAAGGGAAGGAAGGAGAGGSPTVGSPPIMNTDASPNAAAAASSFQGLGSVTLAVFGLASLFFLF